MSEQDAKKPSSNGNTRNESLLEHVIQNVETIHHLCLETFDYYEQKRLEVPSTNASTYDKSNSDLIMFIGNLRKLDGFCSDMLSYCREKTSDKTGQRRKVKGKSNTMYFLLNTETVQRLCSEKGISLNSLGLSIGKSKPWFSSVRKRADVHGDSKISLADANKISRMLECELQDIRGKDESISNPIRFFPKIEAEDHFKVLVSKYPVIMAELLRTIDCIDACDLESLIDIIRAYYSIKEYRKYPDEDWWKSFYTISIMNALDQIEMSPTDVIQRRYHENLEKRIGARHLNSNEEFNLKKTVMVEILKRELDKKLDEGNFEFKLEGKTKEKILNQCAYNLIEAFERRDPAFLRKLNLIKNGNWKLGNLILEISDIKNE